MAKAPPGVLGERVPAPREYQPSILEAIPRAQARDRRGITGHHGVGFDTWHLYELSWLEGERGAPAHYCGALVIPATSPATVESKSLKLYLNSLNFHRFQNYTEATSTIETDLGAVCGAPVTLLLAQPDELATWTRVARGTCIDGASTHREPALPTASGKVVSEIVHSHLLRSLCPVTAQPDWATVEIDYHGQRLDHGNLMNYVLSFREHQDFHEQCIEQIYATLQANCSFESLTVRGFYLRRGGIDITPHRSSSDLVVSPDRLPRQ